MQATIKQTSTVKKASGIRMNISVHKNDSQLKMAEEMLCVAAMAIGMSPDMYKVKSRVRYIAELRFLGAMLLRQNFPLVTLQQIAALFGGQDHSSVINGIQQAYKLIQIKDLCFLTKYEKAQAAVDMWLQKVAA